MGVLVWLAPLFAAGLPARFASSLPRRRSLLRELLERDRKLDFDLVVSLDAERIHQARRNIGDATSVLVRSPIARDAERDAAGLRRADQHQCRQQFFLGDLV